jgi:hypothetical protein
MPREPSNLLLAIASILIAVILAGALWLLVREVLRPPRRTRAGLIALALFCASLVTLQFVTGYYFAFAWAESATKLSVIPIYLLTIVLVLTGKPMIWRLNRIAGILGILVPVVLIVFWPVLLLVGGIVTFGFDNQNPIFSGRMSPQFSYKISISQTFIGNGSYYRYTVFHNPRWLPIVRKQIAEGPLYGCDVPAFSVGVDPGPNNHTWKVWCRINASTIAAGEVSTSTVIAVLKPEARQ